MKKRLSIVFALTLLFAVLTGCSSLIPSGSEGNLVLSIVDAPDLAYEDVHINIQRIFVKPAGGGDWVQLADYSAEPYGINLLDYRIQELVLPNTDVPTGTYEQIRIVLDTNGYITFVGDPTQYPLTVGEEKDEEDDEDADKDDDKSMLGDDEQAIDVEYPFAITAEGLTEIQIDFNVAEMIEPNDTNTGYILDVEEVKAMDKAKASEVEGKITTPTQSPITDQLITVKLFDVNDLVNPVATTWATWEEMDDEDEDDLKAEPGKFKVRGIMPGSYQLTIETPGYEVVTITDLEFVEGEDIEIGEDKDGEATYTITGAEILDERIVLKSPRACKILSHHHQPKGQI